MTLVDIKSRIRQGWQPSALSSSYRPITLVRETRVFVLVVLFLCQYYRAIQPVQRLISIQGVENHPSYIAFSSVRGLARRICK